MIPIENYTHFIENTSGWYITSIHMHQRTVSFIFAGGEGYRKADYCIIDMFALKKMCKFPLPPLKELSV